MTTMEAPSDEVWVRSELPPAEPPPELRYRHRLRPIATLREPWG